MLKNRFGKIIIVMLITVIALLVLAACPDPVVPTDTGTDDDNNITIAEGIAKLSEALDLTGGIVNGLDIINIDLTGQYSEGDNAYIIIFKANIDPSGTAGLNDSNKIYFEIRDSGGQVYIGLYYISGILYLNLPVDGQANQKLYISGLDLSEAIAYTSSLEAGDASGIIDIISDTVDHVTFDESADGDTLTFYINLAAAVSSVFDYAGEQFGDVDISSLLGMFGLTEEEMVSSLENQALTVFSVKLDDDGYVSALSLECGDIFDISITTLTISNGAVSFVVPITAAEYEEYSPTNFDISGEITLDISAGEYIMPIAGTDVTSSLVKTQYVYDFRVRASIYPLDPALTEVLVELSIPDKWAISIYYDGATEYIYVDLADVEMGKLKISGEALAELLNSITEELPNTDTEEVESAYDGTFNSILYLIGIVAPGVSIDSDSVTATIDNERFMAFFNALGIVFPLDITESGAEIVRDGYNVDSVSVYVTMGGIKLMIESDEVILGPKPVIPEPSGLNTYVDYDSVEVFSATMDGTVNIVSAQPNLLTFFEELVFDLTGEEYDLDLQYPPYGTSVNYVSKLNINGDDGSLESMQLDFYDVSDRYILGFNYIADTEKLYVLRQSTIDGETVYSFDEFDLDYDIAKLMSDITGLANPTSDGGADTVHITNSLTALSVLMNSSALYTFFEYLGSTFFESENGLSDDFVFDSIYLSMDEYLSGQVNFPNSKNISFTIENLVLSTSPITFTGIAEAASKNIASVYMNNDLYQIVTLQFSDGSSKKFSVPNWNYNLTGFVNSAGGRVNATADIMGNTVTVALNVAGSSISSLISDVPNDGFAFDKNDMAIDPIETIRSYDEVTVRLSSRDILKSLYWDLTALEDAEEDGVYNIQAFIYDYFGREKRLPSDSLYYHVELSGVDITGHELDMELESYGGIDPTEIDSYPSLAVLTDEGIVTTDPEAEGMLVELYWDLTNILNAYAASGFNAYETGLSTDITVNVPNALGVARELDVHVSISPAIMTGFTFDNSLLGNGLEIDDDLSTLADASGISWDAVHKQLLVNPLRIREITEDILPASVIVQTAAGAYTFTGLKWEYLEIELNNAGATYTNRLRLIVGDDIGGYQTTYVTLKVVTITINDFVLLTQADEEIETSDISALYKLYEIDNPYAYELPVKTFVTTTQGDFTLTTSWSIPTFSTSDLYNGGTYEGTYQAGSQELKMRISVEPAVAIMTGLSFDSEDTDIYFSATKGLVFNPYTSEDFTDINIYPATGTATFSDGLGNNRELPIPIRWNISAITSLYSGTNPNMYLGKSITVTAYTDFDGCGEQLFYVKVYIEEAKIDASAVVYSDDNPTKLYSYSVFGEDVGELTFINPIDADTYPSSLKVSYEGALLPSRIIPMVPEDVEVLSWNIDSVIAAYNAASAIEGLDGTYDIIATVGTLRGGYQTVTMQVEITSSLLENIVFTRIPLLPDGNDAFEYDDTPDEDYIATFTYDPYASNIKSGSSYPAQMEFDLNIGGSTVSFTEDIDWDLANVSGITPYLGGEYTVYAVLPLGDLSVKVPVRIIINEKIADTLDGQGLFTIFIDPLDATPFGRRNSTSMEVKQNVTVTFTEDETEMTLTLIYSREDLLVDFGGVLYMVDAVVGNDFGGYQPIGLSGKIKIAIEQREITSICTDDGDYLELYRRDEEDIYDGETLLYTIISEVNPNILYYESKPETLLFYFTGMVDPVSVPMKDVNTTGLCFEWIDLDNNSCSIKLYNIIAAFLDEEGGDTVYAGNPEVELEVVALQDVSGLLIDQGVYGVDYMGGVVDILGFLNTNNYINNVAMGIDNGNLRCEYYYKGGIVLADQVINAGVYTLRIYVEDHHVYGGYDEVEYEIYKNDYTEYVKIFRDALQKNVTGQNLTESVQFSGEPVEYTATVPPFSLSIDINYPGGTAPSAVGTYEIEVQIDPVHPNETCDITIYLTITKVNLDESSDDIELDYPGSILYGTSDFDVELNAYGEELTGFDLKFYMEVTCTNLIADISVMDVGTYYFQVIYDGTNFHIDAVMSFHVAPATLLAEDYIFTANNMDIGASGPVLTLTVLGEPVDISSATPSYYTDEECTLPVVDISTAPSGQYYVKVAAEIDNYQPFEPVASFYVVD